MHTSVMCKKLHITPTIAIIKAIEPSKNSKSHPNLTLSDYEIMSIIWLYAIFVWFRLLKIGIQLLSSDVACADFSEIS